MAIRTGKFGWLLSAVVCLLMAIPAMADSQARIVRLSSVEGDVEVDRNAGQGWEKAFLNLPITEGTRLWTRDEARAEVEFEDGSTLRLVPQTRVNFQQLSLRSSGAKVSTMNLEQGVLYVNYDGRRDDEYTLNFASETTKLTWPVHFRLSLNEEQAEVAIFRGSVEVTGPSGTVSVERSHSALFALSDDDSYTVAANVDVDPNDAWDKQQSEYHDHYASTSSYNAAMPYAYGVSDLNYYGTYTMVPGYGYMWQPYFAGAGFDPYNNGSWLWYPGFGYTWVSSYPWGWMPYRYGSWNYIPAYGWMWAPGGWNQWYPVAPVSNPPQRYTNPTPPVASPGHRPVMVGKPPVLVTGGGARKLTIEPGSAGLNIPRGGVSNLAKAVDKSSGQPITLHITPPVRIVNDSSAGFAARTGAVPVGMSAAPAWHSSPSYGRPTSGMTTGGSHASTSSGHASSSAGHSSSPR